MKKNKTNIYIVKKIIFCMEATLKTKIRSAIWSSNTNSGIYPKDCELAYNKGS
jgi:hypothetical protein